MDSPSHYRFFLLTFRDKNYGAAFYFSVKITGLCHGHHTWEYYRTPLSDEGLGMKGSMITMTVLVLLYLIGVFISLKWIAFRHLIDSPPIPLIKNGQIINANLRKARISVDLLLSELRKEKIEEVQNVALALWEPDGSISSFLHTPYQTPTRADMNLQPEPFFLPIVLIKEGKIDYHELNKTKHSEQWLKGQLKAIHNLEIKDVLLATVDQKDNLHVFEYELK